MTQIIHQLWTQLTPSQQHRVTEVFGSFDAWLTMLRFRDSSIAVAWADEQPCAATVISHDRIRVGTALVDVAVVRHASCVAPATQADMVELLMHQAQYLLDEGIGILLVHGDVSFWAPYGFAPVSLDVQTHWAGTHDVRSIEPGSVHVGALAATECELVRAIAMTQSEHGVYLVESAYQSPAPWLKLVGRDGQLRATAELDQDAVQQRCVVSLAYAVDDGAAYDLVTALLAHCGSSDALILNLPQLHPVSRMALEVRGETIVRSASQSTLMAGVIDLPLMLHALKPAFSQRLRSSAYADWTGGVRVEIRDERAMIMCDRGEISVIDGTREASVRLKNVEVHALSQMAFGYRSIGALRRAGMLFCDETELRLCETLFPFMAPSLRI